MRIDADETTSTSTTFVRDITRTNTTSQMQLFELLQRRRDEAALHISRLPT